MSYVLRDVVVVFVLAAMVAHFNNWAVCYWGIDPLKSTTNHKQQRYWGINTMNTYLPTIFTKL